MVLLQSGTVRLGERLGKFGLLLRLCILESFAREVESAEKPHQAFSGRALLLALLVNDELLESS